MVGGRSLRCHWSWVNIFCPAVVYLSLIKSLSIKDNTWPIWRRQSRDETHIFCPACLQSNGRATLKTHFPLKIRVWAPRPPVSRILQAVVSLSNLHDEWMNFDLLYSVCLNTHTAQIISMLLVRPWIKDFYNPEEIVECTRKQSKQAVSDYNAINWLGHMFSWWTNTIKYSGLQWSTVLSGSDTAWRKTQSCLSCWEIFGGSLW